MPLNLNKAKITRSAIAHVDLGLAGTEVIVFTFRAPTPEERKMVRSLTRRVRQDDESAQEEAEDQSTILLAALIQSWDIRESDGGPVAEISVETLSAIGDEVQSALWAAISQANEAAAEVGKQRKQDSAAT